MYKNKINFSLQVSSSVVNILFFKYNNVEQYFSNVNVLFKQVFHFSRARLVSSIMHINKHVQKQILQLLCKIYETSSGRANWSQASLVFLLNNMNCLVNDSSLVPDLLHVNQASTYRFLAFQKTETFFILPKMIYILS